MLSISIQRRIAWGLGAVAVVGVIVLFVQAALPGSAALVALFLIAAAMVGISLPWREELQVREFDTIMAMLVERRLVAAAERALAMRRRWAIWYDGAYLQGLAALLLWRVDSARRLFLEAHPPRLQPKTGREAEVVGAQLIAAELAGDALEERSHLLISEVPAILATVANAVRLAREGNFEGLQFLLSPATLAAVPAIYRPLCDTLRCWAEGLPPPDNIALLGETGVDQVRLVWPALADYVNANVSVSEPPLPVVSHGRNSALQ